MLQSLANECSKVLRSFVLVGAKFGTNSPALDRHRATFQILTDPGGHVRTANGTIEGGTFLRILITLEIDGKYSVEYTKLNQNPDIHQFFEYNASITRELKSWISKINKNLTPPATYFRLSGTGRGQRFVILPEFIEKSKEYIRRARDAGLIPNDALFDNEAKSFRLFQYVLLLQRELYLPVWSAFVDAAARNLAADKSRIAGEYDLSLIEPWSTYNAGRTVYRESFQRRLRCLDPYDHSRSRSRRREKLLKKAGDQ